MIKLAYWADEGCRAVGMRRGEAAWTSWCGPVRVPGRGVSRGVGINLGGSESYSQRYWYDQDDSAHQGPAASTYSYFEESSREGMRNCSAYQFLEYLSFSRGLESQGG